MRDDLRFKRNREIKKMEKKELQYLIIISCIIILISVLINIGVFIGAFEAFLKYSTEDLLVFLVWYIILGVMIVHPIILVFTGNIINMVIDSKSSKIHSNIRSINNKYHQMEFELAQLEASDNSNEEDL